MNESEFFRLTPQELEFFAEESRITVIPSFTETSIEIMSGRFGPFKAQKPIEIPLWLAVYLKTRKKCKISIPLIYNEDFLENKIKEEKEDKIGLKNLPSNFYEIFQILFER